MYQWFWLQGHLQQSTHTRHCFLHHAVPVVLVAGSSTAVNQHYTLLPSPCCISGSGCRVIYSSQPTLDIASFTMLYQWFWLQCHLQQSTHTRHCFLHHAVPVVLVAGSSTAVNQHYTLLPSPCYISGSGCRVIYSSQPTLYIASFTMLYQWFWLQGHLQQSTHTRHCFLHHAVSVVLVAGSSTVVNPH